MTLGKELVVVGSLNNDLVAFLDRHPGPGETVRGTDFKTFPGGKGANQAYAAGRLGATVSMCGQVGNDAAGDAQIQNLRSVGVDTALILREASSPTGTAIIAVEAGENRIIIIPGANGTFTPDKLAPFQELLPATRLLLLQLEIPMPTVEAAARMAREAGVTVMLDPAPAAPLSPALLRNVDYLTPNISELSVLTGTSLPTNAPRDEILRAAKTLLTRGVSKVIAKLGHRGAMLISNERVLEWPAFPVTPVDTTAAGDCFNAAFATGLNSSMTEDEAGRFACAAAALSVTRQGAQPSMPVRDEVEALLNSVRLNS